MSSRYFHDYTPFSSSININDRTDCNNNNNNSNNNNGNINSKQSLNLKNSQIIILSFLFTLLQNLSLSKIPGKSSWFIFPLIIILISFLIYYIVQHLPLTTDLFKLKINLAIKILISLTKGVKFDLWLTIIIILTISWILKIWKSSISFIIWCFIIWFYNLNNDNYNTNKILNNKNEFDNLNLSTFETVNSNNLDSTFKESSPYYENYSNSIGYINSLERKIIELEKKINNLQEDKLEQNIIIYTFNHNLNDKINNLDKKIEKFELTNKNDLNQIYNILISVKKRKRIRFNIIKMYIRQILLWFLPRIIISYMKFVKKIIVQHIKRWRGYLTFMLNKNNINISDDNH